MHSKFGLKEIYYKTFSLKFCARCRGKKQQNAVTMNEKTIHSIVTGREILFCLWGNYGKMYPRNFLLTAITSDIIV